VMHATLPKTTDADFIVAGLRKSLTEAEADLRDANGLVSVVAKPEGFQREGTETVDLGAAPARWIATAADGREKARIELSRRSRRDSTDVDAKGKPKLRSPGSFTLEESKTIEKDPATIDKPVRGSNPDADSMAFSWVRWRARGESADTHRARGFAALGEDVYVVDAVFEAEFGTNEDRERALRRFVDQVRVERKSAANMKAQEWYASTFDWSSVWRHNALVSIGTSLLFAAVMLLIARWRLSRIDF